LHNAESVRGRCAHTVHTFVKYFISTVRCTTIRSFGNAVLSLTKCVSKA